MLEGSTMTRLVTIIFLIISFNLYALDLELTQGVNAALPIAVSPFDGDKKGADISDVIKNDLNMSGQFKLVNSSEPSSQLAISSYRNAGADNVIKGVVTKEGSQYKVQYQLYDAAAHGRLLLSKSYTVSPDVLRQLSHHISDEIYEKLTGDKGIFSTRIAYILVKRDGKKRQFNLEIADFDGYKPQALLKSSEPIMSPSWSPDAKQLAYVSFENKRSQIFTVDVATGKRRLITSFKGINGAPSWSPDGKKLAVVLSKSGAPKIYNIDLSSGQIKQLTFGKAIDTEPKYAPDGKSILFTSGRGGSPQIYQLNLASGKVRRVTYEGNYNARASYTPSEKQIVMLHREDERFNIGVQHRGSSRIDLLTSSPMDESPSVSPNGRLVLYATQNNKRGVLAVVSIDGRIRMKLPSRQGDVQEPAWSPYVA